MVIIATLISNFRSPSFTLLPILIVLFTAIISTYSHRAIDIFETSNNQDYILCRECGEHLADPKYINNQLSPLAQVISHKTLFDQKGVSIQLLTNPLKIKFDAITVAHADCTLVRNWQSTPLWYPGYYWRPCVCTQCKHHHGWYFVPKADITSNRVTRTDRSFYLLKLENLIGEKFSDSLVAIPKIL
ncbi:uncharacterized protein LOC106656676 isoform X2 [Trichogramma pretiosum]|uniref:uncharacterized protein LOC106656676 isoform X2 n=1 Tax=Trichogramma pretiosum TaxID=7493 RepID=UPI0006C9D45A|nr:uncharacterized protein LOC106656676 isoform X2 [Trichogramma pretiosum]